MPTLRKSASFVRIQAAIRGLLSLGRDVFKSRIDQAGFDYMQFTGTYPEAKVRT